MHNKLSIPLGELDFLGHFLPCLLNAGRISFNSPWGIRFPWTDLATVIQSTIPAFNSPWGIRFPWTRGFDQGRTQGNQLSIPLGELDFLGQDGGTRARVLTLCFQFPLGN